jgi:hypothetical protein
MGTERADQRLLRRPRITKVGVGEPNHKSYRRPLEMAGARLD